ncbi:MAG: hypothetical protein LBD59_09745 [Prevotellaceae bacterium]|nr:hypothetical protein [Prevotellaceae bacterium]
MKTGKLFFALTITAFLASCSTGDGSGSSDSTGSSSGKGGSMARFCVAGDYLYTVDNQNLKLFNIETPNNPIFYEQRTINLGSGIETIFPMDTLLFIGAVDGMRILDISDGRFPQYLSLTRHITSCDPVVASGNYAYVTLNSSSIFCGRGSNVLQVYDISNTSEPRFIREIPCYSPRGLGVSEGKLFVCDNNGLKVFDIAANPAFPRQIDDLYSTGVEVKTAYDVIPMGNTLILTASNGIFQFDYSGNTLRLLSKISTSK